MEVEEKYMRRALRLARSGRGFTSPNPMVGAVITARGRMIGEGYHRRCGGPHAEVWAVRSIAEKDRHLIPEATVYVTLEPCSHYGKTPPCAKLLIDAGFRHVVVGTVDPNPKVSGRGISMLREAGIEVVTGVLERECRELNRAFITAQTLHRPYILLKWAQSADGFLDSDRTADASPIRFSTPVSLQAMHRLRSDFDAILVGAGTVLADDPMLNVRLVDGRSPRPVVLDRHGRIPASARVMSNRGLIYVSAVERADLPAHVCCLMTGPEASAGEIIGRLRAECISSVMVEGGARVLQAFIDAGLWDDARIEVSPLQLGQNGRNKLKIPSGVMSMDWTYAPNVIINVKNLLPPVE